MTRINCIPPAELVNLHLLAEYRELPRVFRLAQVAVERRHPAVEYPPARYVLGKGHVQFFYTRLVYCANRHALLVTELIHRGYQLSYIDSLFNSFGSLVPAVCWNDWTPDKQAISVNRARIAERLHHTDARFKVKT